MGTPTTRACSAARIWWHVVALPLLLLPASSGEWSCTLQVGNSCAGEQLGPDPTLGAGIVSSALKYFGSDVVSTDDGMLYVLDEGSNPPNLIGIVAATSTVAWVAPLPAGIASWENTLAVVHWPPNIQVIVHATDGSSSLFWGFNSSGGQLWNLAAAQAMVGVTDFGSTVNLLAIGAVDGTIWDMEYIGGSAAFYNLFPAAGCSLATTSPDGEYMICACAGLGPGTALPTALCGFRGAGRAHLYNISMTAVDGTAGSGWVLDQLVMTPAGETLVIVDAMSVADGTQLLSAYAEETGEQAWKLPYPWPVMGRVVRVVTAPADTPYVYVVAVNTEGTAPGTGGRVIAVNAVTGAQLAQYAYVTVSPHEAGVIANVGSDGYTLYVLVQDPVSAVSTISVLVLNHLTGTITETGRLLPPSGSPLDSKGVFLSIGPQDGMLVAAGDGGVTVWRTLPTTTPTGTSTGTGSSSTTPSISASASGSVSVSPTPSRTPSSTSSVSQTPQPTPPLPPPSNAGTVAGATLGVLAVAAVAGGFFFVNYRYPLVVASWKRSTSAAVNKFVNASRSGGASLERVSLLSHANRPTAAGPGGIGSEALASRMAMISREITARVASASEEEAARRRVAESSEGPGSGGDGAHGRGEAPAP